MSLTKLKLKKNKSIFKSLNLLILANFLSLIFPNYTIAQNNNQSLRDLLGGCYRSGNTYQCYNDDQLPFYDSLMRNESAGMSRENQCFANLNSVTYQGTSYQNVHLYYAECSYLSQRYHGLTYACINQPEIYCELIYQYSKR